jgi:predicted DNA binding CopG/RHH family protein
MEKKIKLDKEEAELVRSIDAGEWRSVPNFESEKEKCSEDRRVNIRISTKDLHDLQKHALEEGIPYQTLIASNLHRYLSTNRT